MKKIFFILCIVFSYLVYNGKLSKDDISNFTEKAQNVLSDKHDKINSGKEKIERWKDNR
ncbi:MAG: hypothetical protein P857_998 [Candidatus Xenolissoclinum pacificiensis L6]|uniref:Uncharacterized protein n=1 Tax=Candidatus Xenolissoclinum pacificiensis L6 TaxID=1401685 RepID=W2V149_9RICK|nr:MAG: hypothetical protein P857_998 [Candidatus Xenolissoclinum pacificiensis L6]